MSIVCAQAPKLNMDSLAAAVKATLTAKGCDKYANTARSAAAYFLYTPYSDDIVLNTCQCVVGRWMISTNKTTITISQNCHEGFIDNQVEKGVLLSAYMSAVIIYTIDKGGKKVTLDRYLYAMEETVQYYGRNRERIGKSEYWDKLLELTPEDRTAKLTQLYQSESHK